MAGESTTRRLVLLFIVSALVSGPNFRSEARPEYLELWRAKYPESTLPSRLEREAGSACILCHSMDTYRHDDPGNCYREVFHFLRHQYVAGTFEEALELGDSLDADADGVPSDVEILWVRPDGEVGYHPGLAGERGVDRCGARVTDVITNTRETPPFERIFAVEPEVVGFGHPQTSEVLRRKIHFRNVSPVERTINDLSIGLGEVFAFSIETDSELPLRVAPGESIEVEVTYQETSPGFFYQWLGWPEITTDDPRMPRVGALLRSQGGAAEIEVPSMLRLGIAEVGQVVERQIAVSNRGDLPLLLHDIRWQSGGQFFELPNRISDTILDPGENLAVDMIYAPGSDGSHEDLLILDSDDPLESTVSVPVSGSARWRVTQGDGNQDGMIDVSDPIAILLTLFVGRNSACPEAMDANDDGAVDLSDAIYLLELLFLGHRALPTECHFDRASPYLGCPSDSNLCRARSL